MDESRLVFVSCHRSRAIYRRGSGSLAEQPSFAGMDPSARLSGESLVLGLRDLVESVLGPTLRRDFPRSGGYSFDPVGLFCVWMYGILDGVRSSRRLERSCRFDLRYEYLCRSCAYDHTTLSRFRKSLAGRFEELFVTVCEQAHSQGLLTHRAAAIDGTKMAAQRSQWRRMVKDCEDEEDEPEARALRHHGKGLLGYNVQAAADIDSGMVTGVALADSPNDLRALEPTLEMVGRMSGRYPEKVIVDKGYDSIDNVAALDGRGIEGYVPAVFDRSAPFIPDAQGTYRCLAGHVPCEGTWVAKDSGRVYRHLRVSHCRNCPHRTTCGATGHQRRMKVPMDARPGNRRDANERCNTPEGEQLRKARGPTIERIFALIKSVLGLDRFSLKGKSGAFLEFGLAALAHNLRVLLGACLRLLSLLPTSIGPLPQSPP